MCSLLYGVIYTLLKHNIRTRVKISELAPMSPAHLSTSRGAFLLGSVVIQRLSVVRNSEVVHYYLGAENELPLQK